MEKLAKVKKAVHRLTYYVCCGGMMLLMPLMLVTVADVIGRASMSRPVTGALELSEYILACSILLGLAYTEQVKGHPRVSLVISRLPPRWQGVVQIVTGVLCLFIVSILIWQGWVVAFTDRYVSDALRIPQLPFRVLVSVGAFLLFLELSIDLASSVGKLLGRKP
jgi:TRAP-type C4-dicarboxylate transport system permease small subunit